MRFGDLECRQFKQFVTLIENHSGGRPMETVFGRDRVCLQTIKKAGPHGLCVCAGDIILIPTYVVLAQGNPCIFALFELTALVHSDYLGTQLVGMERFWADTVSADEKVSEKVFGLGRFHVLPAKMRLRAAELPHKGCDATTSGTGWRVLYALEYH